MDTGDRCHFTAGANTVVVTVREMRDDGLVLVQNESHGVGAYPFLVRSDMLIPELDDSRDGACQGRVVGAAQFTDQRE